MFSPSRSHIETMEATRKREAAAADDASEDPLLDDDEAPSQDMSAGNEPLNAVKSRAQKASTAQDMKALESQPGASAPLREERVDDGPGHADLLGSAGPSPASGPVRCRCCQ